MYRTPPLPYAYDALEPTMSEATLRAHHDGHHAGYVDKLNALLEPAAAVASSLEALVTTAAGAVFTNASQAWNHEFFWNCLSPSGGGSPQGALAAAIERRFGCEQVFKDEFVAAGTELVGSGWVWLVSDRDGKLEVLVTHDADSPLLVAKHPVLVCDVWEHAYYLDYQQHRAKFLNAFWSIVNWNFADTRYAWNHGAYAAQDDTVERSQRRRHEPRSEQI
jgi:Fe-Mn family superoxide dismutase